ncbi:MAG: hypothetical protein ABIZ49_12305 [Opitutaceae bacterium]
MKHLRLVYVAFVLARGIVCAQEEERRAPPTEIPDFSNLEEYIYEPRSTVTLGFRRLGGAKTTFSGQGSLKAPEAAGPATGANIPRFYHDGSVGADSRVAARFDSSGNPVIDPESGGQVFDPIAPDGKTSSWNYNDARQLAAAEGYVAFHSYSADIIDTAGRPTTAATTNGVEIAVTRDMGKLFGSKLTWNLTAGMSVNDIVANTSDKVRANLNTLTDYYSLFGQTPPAAPYSAPSSSSQTVLDPNGNPLLNEDGSTQTVSIDTTVLIGNQPAARTLTTTTDTATVTSRWKVKGAYYTFRAGPTVWIPITSRFRISLSAGAALVYAGTSYTVVETFTPEIGFEISDTNSSEQNKLLPGYYADATMQFDLTDRAGFYAGAVFQSAGSYDQKVDGENAHYVSKVDLSNQSGLRAGLSIRF